MKIDFKHILKNLEQLKEFEALNLLLNKKAPLISIKTLSGSSKSFFLNGILKNDQQKLILCSSKKEAFNWLHDLKLVLDENQIAFLVEPDSHVNSKFTNSEERLGWIIEALSVLVENKNSVAIATPKIFEYLLPEQSQIEENKIELAVGENYPFKEFTQSLSLNGFERVDYISEQGEVSIRGGIVDIFPLSFENPIRLEFWGDEIESIREFDPLSQRSINEHENISFIGKSFHNANTEKNTDITKYLSPDCLIIQDSPELIQSQFEDFSFDDNFEVLNINSLGKSDIKIDISPQMSFNASIKLFTDNLLDLISKNTLIYCCAEGNIHLKRFKDLIYNAISAHYKSQKTDDELDEIISKIHWVNETPSSGFSIEKYNIAVFTEHQVFNRHRVLDKSNSRAKSKLYLDELKELKHGDLVVHDDKGVARFEGFNSVTIGGSEQDCIRLVFEGDDVLYVNMNYIHKIQKYSAVEGQAPKLSKLGGTEWARKKQRTKKKLKDIARELIKLYAERKLQKAYSYPIDNVWQKEFEASFIYEDTVDQAKTTEEIKKDMESDSPMDRLVCGDVGFGKTEIAIRAAFKAVQGGKQVAVLVPTTVLAQQHFMTFRDRLSKYPVNVGVLSRFRSKSQQNQTLLDLETGRCDILIGTHRILSKDIKFKELGLLIIDEEQRFGVSAKEKLRQMKVSVDTLTLTATPIPRTLNFSLMGARDLSVIETPPRNRLPVKTEILEWDDDKIVEAIEAETKRGGQVFFVSDKVEDLEKISIDLKMMMPHIKFGIAHGQMKTSELEKVMQNFISGKMDVLVTTKIVESGLDIPNANTMIINRANNFGLAELYQLRGRVGRTNIQAYCYLAIKPNKKLSQVALKRLQAIEEFTDLGSGFQLALRDMEIRGAGNLLGGEQSGAIYDMGFDLYQKILEEAVSELKADEFAKTFNIDEDEDYIKKFENQEVAIELNSDALLPKAYIKNDTERFTFYKRLHAVRTNKELVTIREELEDRYGKLPKSGNDLIYAVKLRIAAVTIGFERIIVKNNKLLCEFPPQEKSEYYDVVFPEIMDYVNNLEGSKMNQNRNKLYWEINIPNREEAASILWKIKKTIEMI